MKTTTPTPHLRYLLGTLGSIATMLIAPLPTHSYQSALNIGDRTSAPKPIQIQHRSLIISKNLQQEIIRQIPTLDRQIHEQFKVFSIPIDQKLNLVYSHQGQDCWKIKFTYGGYLINTTDETLYTTQEIFRLKQAFRSIDKIDFSGRIYDTNGLMQQTGPILHTQMTCSLSALRQQQSIGC
jgi:hypothetical protein